ncbi:hypothetical protein V1T76_11330 [Roseibium sp. FZY0029]|uniref:hypothetical protein n=1 Tax=Roseibium sp. FZY0029 TaxID=3116647 RepID=UPI002EC2B8BD|nr:hypothetical protein [Roseibium sp. FZY0029]
MNKSIYHEVLFEVMSRVLSEEMDAVSDESLEAIAILEDQTRQLCELAQISEREIYTSIDVPVGYLVKEIDVWRVVIPWPLVESFPDDETLLEFCNFAELTKIGIESSICLSGTSVRTSEVPEIGDVDIAEYVFDDRTMIPEAFKNKIFAEYDGLIPIELKQFSDRRPPYIDLIDVCNGERDQKLAEHESFFSELSGCRSKIDFIGFSEKYGPIPITNMILPSQTGLRKAGLALESFSFQEAVIFEKASLNGKVWPLLDMRELFAYFVFLIKECKRQLEAKPVKALKRASSLARFLYLYDYDDGFSDLLSSEYVKSEAVKSRCDEVSRMVSGFSEESAQSQKVKSALRRIKLKEDTIGLNQSPENVFRDRCYELVEGLVNEVTSSLNRYDKRLGREIDKYLASSG